MRRIIRGVMTAIVVMVGSIPAVMVATLFNSPDLIRLWTPYLVTYGIISFDLMGFIVSVYLVNAGLTILAKKTEKVNKLVITFNQPTLR